MRRVSHDDRVALLRRVWLFEQCTTSELSSLAGAVVPRLIDAGQVLAREGENATEFFVVVEGEACASIEGDELARIGPGSFFGELALLDGGARTATVTAGTSMIVLVMDRLDFDVLVDTAILSVGRKMLTVLAERLRVADQRIGNRCERVSGL
jgi:CRP/FNR family transcriptional regulator, cyclic AMP receptor protein